MHLARPAVETQRELLAAVHQDHRVGPDAFHLLGAQVEAVAQAVLGDHQRDVALFLMALEGRLDDLDAVFLVEGTGFFVVDVAEIAERVFRVDGRRFSCRASCRALIGRAARPLERFDRVAA